MYLKSVIEGVGKTPLLKLGESNIFAKLEYFNPLHSVKDRAALFMIEGAEKRGDLKPGGTIVEPTSGNTGIGLTYIGRQKGYRVILTMPENMSEERKKLLRLLGAELVLTPAAEGMNGAVLRAKQLVAELPGAYIPMQFDNPDNVRAHVETTAREIVADLDRPVDYLVVTVGSGGTLTGLSRALKAVYPGLMTVAVEPAESPLLSQGKAGPHGIQGIGANFIPANVDRNLIDRIVTVTTREAFETAKFAAKTYGTLIGISAGAALAASLKIASEHPDKTVVTLFPDTGERYLSVPD
ncbi:MAG TPA: cysteine synthase A [Candidatus Stercoripulliclostridium merdipullorum]|uniref:cysteine synthase n=1 Tax=Candidatus Stercoripulliclostridium merdipullorum TaxID=2840952 RepID=A0A9D1SWF5_9FIRM|nr:cysteine synthase A [Candidatus Stercoripulliclostridium merdipullorum]